MGLGNLADVSLAEARAARDKWQTAITDGKDPISERDRIRDAEQADLDRKDPTLAEVAAIVFDARKAGLRGDGAREMVEPNPALPSAATWPSAHFSQQLRKQSSALRSSFDRRD